MKRIVTIQDISCVGKCSLTVALPIISAMGVETCIIPTAVLSAHTVFDGFTFRDLTEDIKPICKHWKRERLSFDAIYTGYLGSYKQIDLVCEVMDLFASENTLKIVDPCMADNGRLYQGFNQDFAFKMKSLCSKADIIMPNMTEACFMLGEPYRRVGYDVDCVKRMLRELAETGAKQVVIKGVEFCSPQEEIGDVSGKIGIMSYESKTGVYNYYFHDKIGNIFHGTGDIFASVFTGAKMRDFSTKDAFKLSADFVLESIKATLSHDDHNTYGVDFESAIPFLIRQIEK